MELFIAQHPIVSICSRVSNIMVKCIPVSELVNPRRACAARVTGLCVCLLSHISPMERLFVLKTLPRTQRATKVKIFVGFSLKPLRCRDAALAALYCYPCSRPFLLRGKRACAYLTTPRALELASSRATTRTIRRSMRTCARKTKSSTQHQATRQSSTASQQLYGKMQIFFGMKSF